MTAARIWPNDTMLLYTLEVGTKVAKGWRLDPKEVGLGTAGLSSGKRKKATRASRVVEKRGMTVTLTHMPTGLEVSGEIPSGHYSRKQMQQEVATMYSRLFVELEKLVAKTFRIPGR